MAHVILQWLFIIFGIVTFLWGIVMLFRLPDSPATATFLTEEEKLIALERSRANQTGFKNSTIDQSQILEAFTDVKTWLLAILILASNIPNGGFTTVSEDLKTAIISKNLC
jgi:sugar phosphate permease